MCLFFLGLRTPKIQIYINNLIFALEPVIFIFTDEKQSFNEKNKFFCNSLHKFGNEIEIQTSIKS